MNSAASTRSAATKGTVTHPRRGTKRERGAVLVISALTMIMLLLFSALAIDIGLLMTERREDQTAADAAALAGVRDRFVPATLAQTVLTSLNNNLGAGTFTLADLNQCDTTEALPTANWARYSNYNCLAHNQAYTEIRVRVPVQEMETVFAGLGGLQTVEHTAFAQAGFSPSSGDVLPYAVTPNAGDYDCLKSGASNVPDATCNSASSGNFGRVVFGLWGNTDTGTVKDCTGTKMYDINLAQGLDHDLSLYNQLPHNTTEVIDTVSCGATPAPNAMKTDTGNVPDSTYDGLIGPGTFPDGGPSRFQRNLNYYGYFDTTTINGQTVDNTPIWEFIDVSDSDVAHVADSCRAEVFDAVYQDPPDWTLTSKVPQPYVQNHLASFTVQDRMIKSVERCFAHFNGEAWDDGGALTPVEVPTGCGTYNYTTQLAPACQDPFFTKNSESEGEEIFDIQLSARFGYVPEMINTSWPSGSATVRIKSFQPMFLQRAYGGNCSGSGCQWVFDPGFNTVYATGQNKINALTAFRFPRLSLPNGLGDEDAPSNYGSVRFVRLTR